MFVPIVSSHHNIEYNMKDNILVFFISNSACAMHAAKPELGYGMIIMINTYKHINVRRISCHGEQPRRSDMKICFRSPLPKMNFICDDI